MEIHRGWGFQGGPGTKEDEERIDTKQVASFNALFLAS